MIRIILHDILQEKREIWDSANWVVNLLILFLLSGFILALALVAINIHNYLLVLFPKTNLFETFTRLFFFYWLLDLCLRFIFQKRIGFSIKSYQLLPININKLIHYSLIKSLLSLYNVFPLFAIPAFGVQMIVEGKNTLFTYSWVVILSSLVLFNNYLNFYIRASFQRRTQLAFFIVVGFMLIFYFDPSLGISGLFVELVLYVCYSAHYLMLIPILAVCLAYLICYQNLSNNVSFLETESNSFGTQFDYQYDRLLDQKSNVLRYLVLELKMLFRNRRPRTMQLIGFVLLIYGFYFYGRGSEETSIFELIFIGSYLTITFSFQYGQCLFAWESSYFDFLLSSKINFLDYIKSKHWLLVIGATFGFVITAPYGYFNIEILKVNAACLLFNVGISPYLLIWFGTSNKQQINLSRSAFMSYEGIGITQVVVIVLILNAPILIYLPFHVYSTQSTGLLALGLTGGLGFLLKDFMYPKLTLRTIKRKYAMSEAFRT